MLTLTLLTRLKPIKSLKESWERSKKVASVVCRFHDLRHTAATRMLEGGSPLMVVASILGWSASTAARMAKRYGHIGNDAQTKAVGMLMVDRVLGNSSAGERKKGHSADAPSLSKHRKLLKLSGSPLDDFRNWLIPEAAQVVGSAAESTRETLGDAIPTYYAAGARSASLR